MEKTDLESALEKHLDLLSIEFGKRRYIESILGQALIDENFNRIKTKDHPFLHLLGLAGGDYSEEQMTLEGKYPIVFRRQSGIHRNLGINYEVIAPKSKYLTKYEPFADDLIKNKEYDYESLNVFYFEKGFGEYWKDGKPVLLFNRRPNGDIFEVTEFNDFENCPDLRKKINSLRSKENNYVSGDELAKFTLSLLISKEFSGRNE